MEITVQGVKIELFKEKYIFVPDHQFIIISDMHFGKTEHFRKSGIAIPPKTQEIDFQILAQILEKHHPKECIFLGDLFHSIYNQAWDRLMALLGKYPEILFILVKGNHDIISQNRVDKSPLHAVEHYLVNDLIFTHEPQEIVEMGKYNIAGHIHPGVALRGKGKQSLRLPCFYFGLDQGIMPAFGRFTGLYVLPKLKDTKVIAITPDSLIEV